MDDRIGSLEMFVDSVDCRQLSSETTSGFTRVTTELALTGGGVTGRGEDVSYDQADHDKWTIPVSSLEGTYTFESYSDRLDDLEVWSDPPERPAARKYRRWALESAGLDLALRQADTTLGSVLGRQYEPVRFVVSTRLGDSGTDETPSIDRVRDLLAANPDLEFKLDPTAEWDADLIASLADLGVVEILDLKGHYEGTAVDNPPDPDLYRRIVSAFPSAIIEDPTLTPETRPILDPARTRISWDAPISDIDSIQALPFEPAWINIKPSRFGSVESVINSIQYCLDRGISLYGGGQFELGVGRDHIQVLASLFYPDSPNDVAPGVYNAPHQTDDLPSSPISPTPYGLGWVHSG